MGFKTIEKEVQHLTHHKHKKGCVHPIVPSAAQTVEKALKRK